jgi:hypothetical protein
MSLNVEVKKLSQDVSIEEGVAITQNFVLFELPNGGMVKAAIDDSAAEALLDAFVRGADSNKVLRQDNGYEPPARRSPRRIPPPQEELSDDVPSGFEERASASGGKELVFGGDDNKPEEAPKPKPTGKVAVVGKTEMGYPILRGQGNVQDPGEISNGVGQPGSDEDGVASL